MKAIEAVNERHSVRNYTDRKIEGDVLYALRDEIEACNAEGGLHIQLVLDEPKAFSSILARYGRFTNVRNYIVMAGRKSKYLEEMCGYYGERLVIRAQCLGLRTCWVGGTYRKNPDAYALEKDERIVCVIAVGYGADNGHEHRSKMISQLCETEGAIPEWFHKGMEAVLKAPTAMNQQKFRIILKNGILRAEAGFGPYAKTDLGIVRYHFELGAGMENVKWEG